MTVCVAVKVHDCIVFAADSASTLTSTNQAGVMTVLNVYNNADKVFNLRRDLPLMAMTCGMGHIGGRSISNLAKELRLSLTADDTAIDPSKYKVEEVANKAFDFFGKKYADAHPTPDQNHFFEFWIGGYGASKEHGEIWKISIVHGVISPPEQINKEEDPCGVFWGGQGEAIARLLIGIDPEFVNVLEGAGIKLQTAKDTYELARHGLQKQVLSATIPIIDTIRLAEFLVNTTIGYFSFAFGSDIVGGACDIATVTKYEGFKWIKRKHYYPEGLNRSTNDHVC